jgi:hypothetical protein
MMLSLRLLACLVALAGCFESEIAVAADPVLVVTSSPRTLFSARASGCGPNIIPDSPARAFRRADGNMELIAAHYEDWMMLGRSFESLRTNCQSIMAYDDYHQDVPGQLWIQATYTLDGRRIEGFASQDLSTKMYAEGCDRAVHPGHCWANQIISVRSGDMGTHFIPGPVVASEGDTYPPSEVGQFGFFTSTNIVHFGPYYYVILFQSPPHDPGLSTGMTQSGNCMFRSNNFADPSSWRGWTGRGYSYQPDRGQGQCAIIAPSDLGPFRSIQFVPSARRWIAMTSGRHQLPGDSRPVPGFYSMTSPDLVHWENLTRVMPVPLAARSDSMDDIYSYPSLLDPESSTMNFETLDHGTAVLVFSVHHLRNGQGTMNRDLQYVTVQIR